MEAEVLVHDPGRKSRSRRTLGLILARGGSRGVPGKNIRELGGVPLLGRGVETLRSADGVDRVVVSTDDPAIAAVAAEFGADVLDRPASLARDDTPAAAAVRHAVTTLREAGETADRVVLLQVTAPFTEPEDVDAALATFDQVGAAQLMSVTEAKQHPHWMATVDGGRLEFLFDAATRATRRQELPPVYRLNGALYVYDCEAILDGTVDSSGAGGYVMPAERSIDIDTEEDWQRAEAILRELST